MLFALACRPFAVTEILQLKWHASETNLPAGRACSATPAGSVALHEAYSELRDISGLFRGTNDFRERRASRGRHRRRDRTLDERRVRENDRSTLCWAEFSNGRACSQHRASEVRDDHVSWPAGRASQQLDQPFTIRTQTAVFCSSDGKDRNGRPSNLLSEFGNSIRYLVTVRNENQRDMIRLGAFSRHLYSIPNAVRYS